MAELADALDSKSSVPWDVSVRPRSPVFLETVRNSKVREIGLFSLQLQLKSVRNREVFAIYLQSAYFDLLRILELNMHIFSLSLLNRRDLGVLKSHISLFLDKEEMQRESVLKSESDS